MHPGERDLAASVCLDIFNIHLCTLNLFYWAKWGLWGAGPGHRVLNVPASGTRWCSQLPCSDRLSWRPSFYCHANVMGLPGTVCWQMRALVCHWNPRNLKGNAWRFTWAPADCLRRGAHLGRTGFYFNFRGSDFISVSGRPRCRQAVECLVISLAHSSESLLF